MTESDQLHLTRANNPAVQAAGLHIIEMASEQLPQVLALEQQVSKYPWREDLFVSEVSSTVLLMDKQAVLGFAVLALVADQAELYNFAIHPQRQKQALGSIFLDALIDALPRAIKTFYLEVRVTNYPAISLYFQQGFTKIAERKDYYRSGEGSEDALVMSKLL